MNLPTLAFNSRLQATRKHQLTEIYLEWKINSDSNTKKQRKRGKKVPKSSAECLISRTLTFIGM